MSGGKKVKKKQSKWSTIYTRDFSTVIKLGALVLNTGEEVGPPRDHVLYRKAGSVSTFRTKKDRDAHIVAVNADNPGACEVLL